MIDENILEFLRKQNRPLSLKEISENMNLPFRLVSNLINYLESIKKVKTRKYGTMKQVEVINH